MKFLVLFTLFALTTAFECDEPLPEMLRLAPYMVNEHKIPSGCDHSFMVERTFRFPVQDTTAPTLHNLPPATFVSECTPPLPPMVTASDNCDAAAKVDYSWEAMVADPGSCSQIKRTWTAQDDCGNLASFDQILHIEDNIAPTLIGLPPATLELECASAIPAVAIVTATDNCDNDVQVLFQQSEENFKPSGGCGRIIIRSWTATDGCGNSVVFNQLITITDTTAPVFTIMNPAVGLRVPFLPRRMNVQCLANIPHYERFAIRAEDNCEGILGLELTKTNFLGNKKVESVECGGIAKLAWAASDTCGNDASITQEFVIANNQAPVLHDLPEPLVEVSCASEVPLPAQVTATDDCDNSLEVLFNEEKEAIAPNKFFLKRTWSSVDSCGAVSTFEQRVKVFDDQPPVISGVPLDVTIPCTLIENVIEQPITATGEPSCVGVNYLKELVPAANDLARVSFHVNEPKDVMWVDLHYRINGGWEEPKATTDMPIMGRLQKAILGGQREEAVAGPVQRWINVRMTAKTLREHFLDLHMKDGDTIEFFFTYCLERNAKPFDCDTETFTYVNEQPIVEKHCECADLPAPSTAVTAVDNCDGALEVQADTTTSQKVCDQSYNIINTWTATDTCGNTHSERQTIRYGNSECCGI